VRREDAGINLGHAGEDCRSSQLEVLEGEDQTEELVRSEVLTGTASGSAAADGAGLIRVEEATMTEVVAPPPTIGEAASGEVTAANASSDPPG
jgi:hypothetical protein